MYEYLLFNANYLSLVIYLFEAYDQRSFVLFSHSNDSVLKCPLAILAAPIDKQNV